MDAAPVDRMHPRVAIVLVVSIVGLALLAYALGGLIYARVLLDTAGSAYNAAAEDQKSLAPAINSLQGSVDRGNATTLSAAQLQQNRATVVDLVARAQAAQAAQTQIELDDGSLASAGDALQQDRWLTVLSRSSLDRAYRRVIYERKVLGDARTLMQDYGQLGSFVESLYDVLIDFGSITTAAQARDLQATESAIARLKVDIGTAISLDKAPGLPAEVDTLMLEIQVVANDFSRTLNAALSHDASALAAAEVAGRADVARIQAFPYRSITIGIDAFYAPLVDAYNVDVARAGGA